MQYFNVIRIGLILTIGFSLQGQVLAENDYPAAYFEPYIIYQAPEVAGKPPAASESDATEESATQTASEPEEKEPYPAAYFQPTIVYQDKDFIANQAAPPAPRSEAAPVKKPAAAIKKPAAPVKKPAAAIKKPAAAIKKQNSPPAMADPPPASDAGGVPPVVIVLLLVLIGGLYWTMFRQTDDTPVSDEPAVPVDEVSSGDSTEPEAEKEQQAEPEAKGA